VHIVRAAQVDDRHAEPSFAALAFGARLKPTGEKPRGHAFCFGPVPRSDASSAGRGSQE